MEMLDKTGGLEEQLRQWQADRAQKARSASPVVPTVQDRRTVRINGRDVEIVRKPRRSF